MIAFAVLRRLMSGIQDFLRIYSGQVLRYTQDKLLILYLVGDTGFEPATSPPRAERASQLCQSP